MLNIISLIIDTSNFKLSNKIELSVWRLVACFSNKLLSFCKVCTILLLFSKSDSLLLKYITRSNLQFIDRYCVLNKMLTL